MYNTFQRKNNPLQQQGDPALLTWRASFLARGDEFPSTLVSGLPTTAPPLGFYPSLPFAPHSSYYIIYIDDINNLGRRRPGQLLSPTFYVTFAVLKESTINASQFSFFVLDVGQYCACLLPLAASQ